MVFIDRNEPPPSYQDVVSNYNTSSTQSSDVLPEDDHQSPRSYAQYRGDKKSSTLDTSSNGFRRRSEEGTSVLERRRAFRATFPINDKNVGKPTLLSVHPKGVLGANQENLSVSLRRVRMQLTCAFRIDGGSSASKFDGERVLGQHTGVMVVSSECASSTLESHTTQQQLGVETLPPSHSISSYEVHTTTHSYEVADESLREECQGHVSTRDDGCITMTDAVVSAVVARNQASVFTVDEEEDAIHRRTTHLSTTVAMQTNEEVRETVSPVLVPDNDAMLCLCLSDSVATESRARSVADNDIQAESEDLECTSRMDGSHEQPINLPSS